MAGMATALGIVAIGSPAATGSSRWPPAMSRNRSLPPARRPSSTTRQPPAEIKFVTGRVLDPEGKPIPNAAVSVYADQVCPLDDGFPEPDG